MLTWSLACAPSPASFAITSLAFVLVEVPEPVWKTSIGNCPSCLPSAISRAAFSIFAAVRLGSRPSSPLTAAAAPFRRASQCTTGSGTVSPEIGKFSTAFAVSGPHSCLRAAIGRDYRLPAEGRQLARQSHGVVIGHQEAGALEHPQLPRR